MADQSQPTINYILPVVTLCTTENPFRFKMEIGRNKTKVMINNPNGFQREIKIKGQRLEAVKNFKYRLEAVKNFKYLGSIICNESPKTEILSRIAQITAALSKQNILWRDKKYRWLLMLS